MREDVKPIWKPTREKEDHATIASIHASLIEIISNCDPMTLIRLIDTLYTETNLV